LIYNVDIGSTLHLLVVHQCGASSPVAHIIWYAKKYHLVGPALKPNTFPRQEEICHSSKMAGKSGFL